MHPQITSYHSLLDCTGHLTQLLAVLPLRHFHQQALVVRTTVVYDCGQLITAC